jgi:capsular exopolysaccharide synthesis family protein
MGKEPSILRLRRRAELRRARKEYKSNDLSGRLVTILDPTSAASEDYRSLRATLVYALEDNPSKVIVLTSPGPREGKSTTCANLGVALAQADRSTLILDCDLRRPMMHKIFGQRDDWGIVAILAEERSWQEVCQEPLPGLKVIAAGPTPHNPTELLSSRRFAEFLDQARQEFDYILIDTPATDLVSDPAVIAAQGDGVLLVLDARDIRKGPVLQAMRRLQTVGATVLGTIMNDAKVSKGGYYPPP